MIEYRLSDLVKQKPITLSICYGAESFELENSVCYVIFNDTKSKTSFLCSVDLNKYIYINTTFNKLQTGVFEQACIREFDELMGYLDSLCTSDRDILINGVVIDDISRFYWEFKSRNQLYKYNQLVNKLASMKKKYRYNFLIFSWNVNYDNGFNNNWKQSDKSYIPINYHHLDNILYINNTKIFNINAV